VRTCWLGCWVKCSGRRVFRHCLTRTGWLRPGWRRVARLCRGLMGMGTRGVRGGWRRECVCACLVCYVRGRYGPARGVSGWGVPSVLVCVSGGSQDAYGVGVARHVGCPVSRVLTVAILAVLWVGAVRLIVGARPAGPMSGRVRTRVGWVVACVAAFAAGVLAWSPDRW
jgi:hypothetical protein